MNSDTVWRVGGLLPEADIALGPVVSWRIHAGEGSLRAEVRVLSAPAELERAPAEVAVGCTPERAR